VSKVPEYTNLFHLFCTVLGLENAGLYHYLDDLASLKENEDPLIEHSDVAGVTRNLYRELGKILAETEPNTSTATRQTIR
jgi:hypothetical protein